MNDMIDQKLDPLFSIKAIGVATYFGGPIAGGWLIAANFHRLNQKAARNKALSYSLAFTVILFLTILKMPEHIIDQVPNFLIPAVYTPIFTLYAQKLQGTDIRKHLENDGKKRSGWAAFGISLVSLLVTLTLTFGLIFLLSPIVPPYEFEGEMYNYGTQAHVIYHNNVDTEVLNKCGDFLLSNDYLSTEYQGILQIHKTDNGHQVFLTFSREYWNNSEFIEYVNHLKRGLEQSVFEGSVEMTITDEDWFDVYTKHL